MGVGEARGHTQPPKMTASQRRACSPAATPRRLRGQLGHLHSPCGARGIAGQNRGTRPPGGWSPAGRFSPAGRGPGAEWLGFGQPFLIYALDMVSRHPRENRTPGSGGCPDHRLSPKARTPPVRRKRKNIRFRLRGQGYGRSLPGSPRFPAGAARGCERTAMSHNTPPRTPRTPTHPQRTPGGCSSEARAGAFPRLGTANRTEEAKGGDQAGSPGWGRCPRCSARGGRGGNTCSNPPCSKCCRPWRSR